MSDRSFSYTELKSKPMQLTKQGKGVCIIIIILIIIIIPIIM